MDYSGLKPGKTYVLEGILMDKSTGMPLLDDNGNEVKGTTEFVAEKEKGRVEVFFNFCGESLGGRTAVVFEYLKLETEIVAEHTDINSREQTVNIIEIAEVKEEYDEEEKEEEVKDEYEEKEKSPDTGDGGNLALLFYMTALGASVSALLLTKKRRNDRLN